MDDRPQFDKGPFVRTRLEKTDDTFTIRLNAQEREWLDAFKQDARISSDGTAIKVLAEIGLKVTHATFGREILAYLASARRLR